MLLAITGVAAAQDATPKPVEAPAVPSAPVVAPASASDPAAVALLAKAAVAQRGGGTASGDAPLALRVKVRLQYRSPQGDDVAVEAERRFRAPDRIWTRAKSSFDGAETWSGYDGKRPWLRSGKNVRWLDEPGGEADWKQLQQDFELTELLTGAFQLDRLAPRLTELNLLPDVSAHAITARVVEGKLTVMREGQSKPARVWLYFDEKELHLMGARLMPDGEEAIQVCFTKHERNGGLDVPGKVELWADGEANPRQTLYIVLLEVAPVFSDADFAPPR